MRLSLGREVFAIPRGNDYIVYAPLSGAAVLCSSPTIGLLRRVGDGDDTVLEDSECVEALQVLTAAGILDAAVGCPAPERGPSPSDFAPTRATLLLTTDCNLRCAYCYASAGETVSVMPFELCAAAIDLIVLNAERLLVPDVHVAFHGGGEPTTAFALIRECTDYARGRAEVSGLRVSFSVVTNGMLNDEQIDWLAANMYGISVSLDGPRDIQDAQRPTRGGGGSFDKAFYSIKRLERLGAKPFIRATITDSSVGRMGEISRFFCDSFESEVFQLEPVAGCGRCATTGVKEPTADDFVRGALEAMREANAVGKRAVCSVAHETFPNLLEAYCGVAAPNFAVTPDGIATACYEVAQPSDQRGEFFYYGRYDAAAREFSFREDAIARLRGRVVDNIEGCADCFCRWQCAGDCPVRSIRRDTSDSDAEAPAFRCAVTRALLASRLVAELGYGS